MSVSQDPASGVGLILETQIGVTHRCPFPSEFPTYGGALGTGSAFSRGQGPRVEELGTQERACEEGTPFHVDIANPRASAQDAKAGNCLCSGCIDMYIVHALERRASPPRLPWACGVPSHSQNLSVFHSARRLRLPHPPYPHHAHIVVLSVFKPPPPCPHPKCLSCPYLPMVLKH